MEIRPPNSFTAFRVLLPSASYSTACRIGCGGLLQISGRLGLFFKFEARQTATLVFTKKCAKRPQSVAGAGCCTRLDGKPAENTPRRSFLMEMKGFNGLLIFLADLRTSVTLSQKTFTNLLLSSRYNFPGDCHRWIEIEALFLA